MPMNGCKCKIIPFDFQRKGKTNRYHHHHNKEKLIHFHLTFLYLARPYRNTRAMVTLTLVCGDCVHPGNAKYQN